MGYNFSTSIFALLKGRFSFLCFASYNCLNVEKNIVNLCSIYSHYPLAFVTYYREYFQAVLGAGYPLHEHFNQKGTLTKKPRVLIMICR